MKYDSAGRKLINILYPIAMYMAIGLVVLSIYQKADIIENLIEKSICAVCMIFLYHRDSQNIEKKKSDHSCWEVYCPVILGVLASLAVNLLFSVSGLFKVFNSDVEEVKHILSSQYVWIEIIEIVIAAPLAEEFLFRGVIYRRMRTYMKVLPAAAVSSILFGVLHGNIIQAVFAVLLSIFIIYVYEYYNSIAAACIFHMAANAASMAAARYSPLTLLISNNMIIIMLSCIALLCLLIFFMEKHKKGNMLLMTNNVK